MDVQLVSTDHSTSDHTVVNQPDCLYGPKMIDLIMSKPSKLTIIMTYVL